MKAATITAIGVAALTFAALVPKTIDQGPPSPGAAALSPLEQSDDGPQPPPIIRPDFIFIYPQPLTDGYLQSSTDLVHWVTRTDYTVQTNVVDGTNFLQWTIDRDPSKPCEFYRAGGKTIL